MVDFIVETVWLFLPAIIANMMPVFAARYNWIPVMNIPIDGGITWGNKPLFGQNKTVRGFVFGVAAAAIVALLQDRLLIVGILMGLGALCGDAAKSFFKRRIGIPSGKSFPVFDQIDFALGAIVFTYPFINYNASQIFFAIIVLGIGSLVTSIIGTTMHVKKNL